MSNSKLMVIDTDCGVDDALAIMLALTFRATWKILAITCVDGNTTVDNACGNVQRVLELFEDKEIPVYRGCDRALLCKAQHEVQVHGNDGLGDAAKDYPIGNRKVGKGHAANILVELAKQYKGQIHLVALGPLTNLALAHRLDPEFTANLKALSFMGGNVYAEGNTTSAAEYNFHCDPESAHIILAEARCPVTMVPWETTIKNAMPWDFYDTLIDTNTKNGIFLRDITKVRANVFKKRIAGQIASELKHLYQALVELETKNANFLRKITKTRVALCKRRGNPGFMDCDFLAMASVLHPECVVQHVVVDLADSSSKTKLAVLVIRKEKTNASSQKNKIDICAIMEFNQGLLNEHRKMLLE